jgi:hypothetical protein
MAALTRKSIRLSAAALAAALALAAPAVAGDVSVQLDSGAGFSIRNNTGAIERLRVDEATGNISHNGALFVHTTGANNTFVGVNAGNTSTGGFGHNSAVGYGALRYNTTGWENSAFGNRALHSNTTGGLNSAFGDVALASNTTGGDNSAFGHFALYFNTTGSFNSAFGVTALIANTTGNFNSAVGTAALADNTTGAGNVAVGNETLFSNTTGNRNVAVGQYAGQNQTTGSDNIYLANWGVAAESNTIRIGTLGTGTGTHNRAFVAGIRGVTTGVADAIPVLIDSAGQLGTVSSSRSVKKDIRDMGDATAKLLDLRPVTFHYKQEQTLPDGHDVPPEYGLIAEEVAEVLPDLVVYDEKGQPFTVKYHEMAPMLLNEMKKQQRTIEAQQQEMSALTTRLAQLETRVSGKPGEAQ